MLSDIIDALVGSFLIILFVVGIALVAPFYILYVAIGFGVDCVKDKRSYKRLDK